MVSFEFDNNSAKSLYVQLYEHLRDEISDGRSLKKMYDDMSGEGLQPVLNDYLYV